MPLSQVPTRLEWWRAWENGWGGQDTPGLGRGLSSRPVSPHVEQELLTSLFLHYFVWEIRVQIINFWFLNLSDKGSCEPIEVAFSGLAYSENLSCWPT